MSRPGEALPRPLAGRILVSAALAMAGLLALRFLVADDGYPAILGLRGRLLEAKTEVQSLYRENADLRQRIVALEAERYPVEKLAREELDFAVPGELIYLFPNHIPAPTSDAEAGALSFDPAP